MSLSLIVASSLNGVIGRAGDLPWHLPADLRHFKETTLGKTIVMGRKTWESIGRALPGRTNVVLSRKELSLPDEVLLYDELEEVVKDHPDAMIIGGAQIYALALQRGVGTIHWTKIHVETQGDAHFQLPNEESWTVARRDFRPKDEKNPYDLEFVELISSSS